ncbi:MAG: hypothetical protein ACHQX3_06145 [Nitrospirales bacterium]
MKPAIVVLVILVIAFAVAAGRRAPTAKTLPDDTPGWLKSLGDRFKPKFDFRDVTRECFDESTTTFNVGGACVVRISRSPTKFRQLTLKIKQGGASIHFQPAPDDDSGLSFVRRTLPSDGSAETLVLPSSGGSLNMICVPPGGVCSINAE